MIKKLVEDLVRPNIVVFDVESTGQFTERLVVHMIDVCQDNYECDIDLLLLPDGQNYSFDGVTDYIHIAGILWAKNPHLKSDGKITTGFIKDGCRLPNGSTNLVLGHRQDGKGWVLGCF